MVDDAYAYLSCQTGLRYLFIFIGPLRQRRRWSKRMQLDTPQPQPFAEEYPPALAEGR